MTKYHVPTKYKTIFLLEPSLNILLTKEEQDKHSMYNVLSLQKHTHMFMYF